MRATIEPRDRSVFVQMIRAQRLHEAERTGLHCSTIVQDIAKSIAPGAFREGIDEATGLSFQEIGNVMEDLAGGGLQRRFPGWSKPEPRAYRGIICSPDGDSPRVRCLDEVKVTWKSEASKLDGLFIRLAGQSDEAARLEPRTGTIVEASAKFAIYRMQILFYMSAWQYVRGRLHVLFMNGNYHPPFPDPVTIRLYPTPEELQTNEDLIVGHAKDRGWL